MSSKHRKTLSYGNAEDSVDSLGWRSEEGCACVSGDVTTPSVEMVGKSEVAPRCQGTTRQHTCHTVPAAAIHGFGRAEAGTADTLDGATRSVSFIDDRSQKPDRIASPDS